MKTITLKSGKEIELNQAFNVDCLDFMKELPDKCIPWVLTDPNYGRGEHGGVNRSGLVKQKNGSKTYVKGGFKKKDWDNTAVSEEYLNEIVRVSENQIIFGANYFPVNLGNGRIIWDKCNEGSDQSDCEIAYISSNSRVDKISFMWRGMFQGKSIAEGTTQQGNKSLNEKKIHPTQKPVKLISEIIKRYIPEGELIVDFYAGSFSHVIAFAKMGNPWLACEKDKDYYISGYHRYEQETKQMLMEF